MNGLGIVVTAVAAVAAAVTVLLGVPAFWVLRRFGREGWRSLGAVGAALGVLPVAFFWPRHFAGYSSGQNWHGHDVDLYVDGTPTVYAWLIYAEKVLTFGLHGLIGALVFYAVLRRLSRGPRLIQGADIG